MQDQKVGVRNYAVLRNGVIKFGVVLEKLVGFLEHLASVLLCHGLAFLIDFGLESRLWLYRLRWGFFEILTVEPVPEEHIEMFLYLSTLDFIQIELLLRICLLSFFKIDGIDMINPNQPKQEHTNIPGIDPKLLNNRVRIMQQYPFIDRNPILRLFILLDKAHMLQYLIEHYVIDLVVDW